MFPSTGVGSTDLRSGEAEDESDLYTHRREQIDKLGSTSSVEKTWNLNGGSRVQVTLTDKERELLVHWGLTPESRERGGEKEILWLGETLLVVTY